ncbi:MAG: DNA polymerase III subunit gamma/tau [Rickettsiales bacterium]
MEYRVLARKYRPTNFDDLIGQEVLVKTLSNAIASGRIAHAFLLTGIRGIGKTTTARIIARALNCVGEDGNGGATISPCGVCPNCKMIAEDRHVDVLEMDAASHTGVGDIRELIDTVRYLPTSARYKIYIIDEVHMLSNSAFNALLKTLEEPPPHVKFIFATTEARKIPVTILSRCQRFDLKRIEHERMAEHLANIAAKENINIEADATKLLAVAAEGSVRDGLSLLDQAIARGTEGDAPITAEQIRHMLGAADNTATFALLESLLKGDIAKTLEQVTAQYTSGGDPLLMVQDALSAIHLVTRIKVAPEVASDVTLSEHDRKAALNLAENISMPVITRLWQMFLKGLGEVRVAPSPISALEMLLVRIAYAAELPTPGDVIRGSSDDKPVKPAPVKEKPSTPVAKPSLEIVSTSHTKVASYEEVVALFEEHREALLYAKLRDEVELVAFEQGKLTLHFIKEQQRDFTARVCECLQEWTGQPWNIVVSEEKGDGSLYAQEQQRKADDIKQASEDPLVASVLEQFPGATVTSVSN